MTNPEEQNILAQGLNWFTDQASQAAGLGSHGDDLLKKVLGDEELKTALGKLTSNGQEGATLSPLQSLQQLHAADPTALEKLNDMVDAKGFKGTLTKFADSGLQKLLQGDKPSTPESQAQLIGALHTRHEKGLNQVDKDGKPKPEFFERTEAFLGNDNTETLAQTVKNNPQIAGLASQFIAGNSKEGADPLTGLDMAMNNPGMLEQAGQWAGMLSWLPDGAMNGLMGLLETIAGFIDGIAGKMGMDLNLKSYFNDAAAPEGTKPTQDAENKQTTEKKPAAEPTPEELENEDKSHLDVGGTRLTEKSAANDFNAVAPNDPVTTPNVAPQTPVAEPLAAAPGQ